MHPPPMRGRGGRQGGLRSSRYDPRPPSGGSAVTNSNTMNPTYLTPPREGQMQRAAHQQLPLQTAPLGVVYAQNTPAPPPTFGPLLVPAQHIAPAPTGHRPPHQQPYQHRPPQTEQSTNQGPNRISAMRHRKPNKAEWERIRSRVRKIAPELFKNKSYPFGERSESFPRAYDEYVDFKRDMRWMRAEELEKNMKKINAMVAAMSKIPKDKREIKSVFGQGGKIFADGRGGPVLMKPTIWSAEFEKLGPPSAPWPEIVERICYGDQHKWIDVFGCGRYFPPPRRNRVPGVPFVQFPIVDPYPLDLTGPLHFDGPSPMDTAYDNFDMDHDEDFEKYGEGYLGEDLMKEIGKKEPPYFPFAHTVSRQGPADAPTQELPPFLREPIHAPMPPVLMNALSYQYPAHAGVQHLNQQTGGMWVGGGHTYMG